jgi:hypothetical protein
MTAAHLSEITFKSIGKNLVLETKVASINTMVSITAEISNENHRVRAARLLALEQAATLIQTAIEEERERAHSLEANNP